MIDNYISCLLLPISVRRIPHINEIFMPRNVYSSKDSTAGGSTPALIVWCSSVEVCCEAFWSGISILAWGNRWFLKVTNCNSRRCGSFKDRKPVGEVSCCDSWMAERISLSLSLSVSPSLCVSLSLYLYYIYIYTYTHLSNLSFYLSAYLFIYVSI